MAIRPLRLPDDARRLDDLVSLACTWSEPTPDQPHSTRETRLARMAPTSSTGDATATCAWSPTTTAFRRRRLLLPVTSWRRDAMAFPLRAPTVEPCMRFSGALLTDVVHRRDSVSPASTARPGCSSGAVKAIHADQIGRSEGHQGPTGTPRPVRRLGHLQREPHHLLSVATHHDQVVGAADQTQRSRVDLPWLDSADYAHHVSAAALRQGARLSITAGRTRRTARRMTPSPRRPGRRSTFTTAVFDEGSRPWISV